MAISKQTALDMLRWFKAELDDSVDTKIATIAGGDKNVIETVKVNNSALPVSNKAVNIDLSAYAKTADVDTKLATITGSGEDNVIERISLDGNIQPVTGKTATLNLSDYAKKNDLDNAISSISSLSTLVYSLSNYTIIEGAELNPATKDELGVIKVGYGLEMDENDALNVTLPAGGEIGLPIATKEDLGGIIVGSGLSVKDDGTLSVIPPESVGEFFLNPATEYDLGGVKVGEGLSITDEGVLSVIATGGDSNVIEQISIDGKIQPVDNKTAILGLSAYAKKNEVGSGIRMKGSVNSYGDLPADAVTGDLYNIKQAGGSDGAGIPILAGDNVVFTDKGTWDVMAGFIDTSNFLTKDDFSDELKEKLEGLSSFTLLPATADRLGGIKVGDGLSITGEGILNAESTSVFQGADENGSGSIGLVPAPLTRNTFLRGDGYWAKFPSESLNVIVGGGSLNGVNVEAISYPPNMEGVLWMDTGEDSAVVEPCLRLRHGDYEYIFKADFFNPTTVNSSTSTTGVITPAIYYLGTVPSELDGGLWYTLENQHPTLWVHRKWTHTNGDVYDFDFGYSYDLIAYKGSPSTDLYSYLVMRPNLMADIFHRSWTTTVSAPVIEKTDHGIYALRNLNTATATYLTSSGWMHTFTDTWGISSSISLIGKSITTIDFWLSWNADTSEEHTGVVANGNTSFPILNLTGTTIYSNQPGSFVAGTQASWSGKLAVYNTSLQIINNSTASLIQGCDDILESNDAKRLHIALTHVAGSPITLYINGKRTMTFGTGSYRNNLGNLNTTYLCVIKTIQIFPYMVGTETEYRPLYIDHLRIWNVARWTEDFEPPKPEDYIIW